MSISGKTPALVIFDKDGTLIDFNFMWGSWISELARRLEHVAPLFLPAPLFSVMGYDAVQHAVIAGSPLAAHSMADLFALTIQVAQAVGLSPDAAARAVSGVWFVPDPVALARPLADLPRLFSALRAGGTRIAIATSDDRNSTEQTLRALGVAHQIDALVSADDGLPNKPAPDMLLRVCAELNVLPGASVMVGDSTVDMLAARAAGIGLRVAVLTGLADRAALETDADMILDSVAALL